MGIRLLNKATKQVVDVSSAEAVDLLNRGEAEPVPGQKYKVSRAGDRTGSTDASRLSQALAEGWSLATDEEVAKAKLRKEESTAGSQALAAVEGAGAALTMGLSTVAEEKLGISPERMVARRQAAGGLVTAAEAAGALGGIALTGGFSAAGRGLGSLVARGAAEGAYFGAGSEIDDSVLDGRDITAEHVAAAAGWGGLLGGATSAIVPGVVAAGAGLGKVGMRPIRSVLSKAAGVADDFSSGGAAKLLTDDNIAKVAHWMNSTPDDVRATFAHATPAEAKAWLDAIQDGTRVTENAANDLRPLFEEMRATGAAVRIEHGALRHVEANLPKSKDALISAHDQGARFLAVQRARVADELAAVESRMSNANAPSLRRIGVMINQAEAEIADAARRGVAPKELAALTNRAINRTKQGIWDTRQVYKRIARGPMSTPEADDMMRFFDTGDTPLYPAFVKHLESEQIWGKAGLNQQALNSAYSNAAQLSESLGRSASGKLLDPLMPIDNADLLTVIKNSSSFKGATKTERLVDALKARVDYFKAAKDQLDLPPATRAAIEKQETLIKRLEETMGRQRAKVNAVAALDRLDDGFSSSVVGTITRNAATGIGAGLGSLVGGPVGGLVGAVSGKLLSSNVSSVRRLAVINARAMASQKQYGAAIGKFLHQISNGTAAIGRAAETAGRQVARATPIVARAAGGRDEHLRSTIERARLLTRNPQLLATEVDKATAELEDVPRLKGVLAMKATQAALYLATVAPAGYQAPYSTRPPIYDPIALARFERTLEAVNEPYRALARLADGTFSKEHADALRAVWPAIYAKAQEEILSALAEAEAGGKTIPLTVQTRLGVFVNARTTPFIPLPSPPVQIPAPAGPGKPPEYKPLSLATQTQQIGTIK